MCYANALRVKIWIVYMGCYDTYCPERSEGHYTFSLSIWEYHSRDGFCSFRSAAKTPLLIRRCLYRCRSIKKVNLHVCSSCSKTAFLIPFLFFRCCASKKVNLSLWRMMRLIIASRLKWLKLKLKF